MGFMFWGKKPQMGSFLNKGPEKLTTGWAHTPMKKKDQVKSIQIFCGKGGLTKKQGGQRTPGVSGNQLSKKLEMGRGDGHESKTKFNSSPVTWRRVEFGKGDEPTMRKILKGYREKYRKGQTCRGKKSWFQDLGWGAHVTGGG